MPRPGLHVFAPILCAEAFPIKASDHPLRAPGTASIVGVFVPDCWMEGLFSPAMPPLYGIMSFGKAA
jgi:hypothetical protein